MPICRASPCRMRPTARRWRSGGRDQRVPYDHRRDQRELNHEERATATRIIEATPPGRYRLRDLYGEEWELIHRPKAHGRWFRASVRAEALPRVRWLRKGSDKSHVYEVLH